MEGVVYELFSSRRLLGAVAIVALLVALAPSSAWSVKPDSTREFNTCMSTCNGLKEICDMDCATACNGDEECAGPCLQSCARLMQGCKGTCKFEKTGKEPNIPD